MGKISEALEKSGERQIATGGSVRKPKALQPKKYPEKESTVDPAETFASEVHLPNTGNRYQVFDRMQEIHRTLITVKDPESVEAEQFRLMKNNILFPEKGIPPKSLMVTSSSPNEGKSFVAANLAISMAQSIDEYVLLMDCDLRSPTIHKTFGLPETGGLSEHLTQAKPLSSLMLRTFIDKLTILPAGSLPSNPSELLSSELMRRLIKEVTLRYSDRYIIIDAPPPYMTSEASALARQVDAIILVIRHGKTRKKDVENIISMYGKEKIFGVVHNFAEKRPGYGHGYYKYGYGK